jgi:hypothetical protein
MVWHMARVRGFRIGFSDCVVACLGRRDGSVSGRLRIYGGMDDLLCCCNLG